MTESGTWGARAPITPAVKWLLAANTGVYFLQLIVFGSANTFAALALDAGALPAGWWALLTYMFVHGGLVHLALNMFILWSFGPRLEEVWGSRSFLAFYAWCGFGAAITHLVVVRGGYLVGASGAIYGLMLAYATLWKDDEIFIFGVLPVRARWLMVWLVGISLVYSVLALRGLTSVAAFAHLGGLLFAWVYLHGPGGSGLARVKQQMSAVPDDTGEMPRVVPRQTRRARERMSAADEVVAESKALAGRRRPEGESRPPHDTPRADLDALLDKIARSGLESLTAEERRLLETRSRELRNRD